ncbi:MAG: apolipoprotein N-acyltransferase 2 [Leptospiraceae bacterium]|nr:MAG: apolipoprotein N-acyltransferase 2 [Leptospiraceae bacterium]
MKKKFLPIILSILFGISGTLSLEPFSIPLIRWMVPWFLFYSGERLKNSSYKKIIGISFLYALSLCIFAFYWVIHLFVEYGGIPLLLSIFLFIPYSILLNSKIPFILIFLSKIKPKYKIFYKYNFISIPLIITLIDLITPQVFNWYWGNLITKNLLFSQIADILGIHGLTFLYIFFSYAFYRIFKLLYKNYMIFFTPRFKKIYGYIFIFFLGIHIYGIIQIKRYNDIIKNSEKIRIAIIQPDAPLEKYGENKVTIQVIENLMLKEIPELTKLAFNKGEGKIDLFILPESGIPYFTTQKNSLTLKGNAYHPYFEYLIHSINAQYMADVFFNEFFYEQENNKIHVYNSSSLFSRKGKREAQYHKRKLIAFGEQIPLAEFLDETGLIQLVPESVRYSRFKPGKYFIPIPYTIQNYNKPVEITNYPFKPIEELTRPEEIQSFFKNREFKPYGYFMPLICYEIIQPEYVRNFFLHSPYPIDFIVNITQDKWYGKTIESYQHLALGSIRAIELRRSIVRSTNSGVSTSIEPTGNYIKPIYGNILTEQETKEIQIVDIPIIKDHKTIYSYIGLGWLYIILFYYVILNVMDKIKRLTI